MNRLITWVLLGFSLLLLSVGGLVGGFVTAFLVHCLLDWLWKVLCG